jgi:hypothetical protein
VKFGIKDELGEHGRREDHIFLISINEIAFKRVPLNYDLLKGKNALAKSVCYITE